MRRHGRCLDLWVRSGGAGTHSYSNEIPVQVLEGTSETALIFAEIKNALKSSGSPIPLNDGWIAANAIETGSVLITFDKHFALVPGLRIWDEIG